MKVKVGDSVKVDYEGRFESGEVFDSSKHGDHSHPLVFKVGNKEVIDGFDKAVVGMEVGEEKEFKLSPGEGYGQRNEQLLQKIPRDRLPLGQEPQAGMVLMLKSPEGHQIPAKITAVDDKNITIDLNHPLAGKTLIFKIKLVEITS